MYKIPSFLQPAVDLLEKNVKIQEALTERLFQEVQELEDVRKTVLAKGEGFTKETLLREKKGHLNRLRPVAEIGSAFRALTQAFEAARTEESTNPSGLKHSNSDLKHAVINLNMCLHGVEEMAARQNRNTTRIMKNNWAQATGQERLRLLRLVGLRNTQSFVSRMLIKAAKGAGNRLLRF